MMMIMITFISLLSLLLLLLLLCLLLLWLLLLLLLSYKHTVIKIIVIILILVIIVINTFSYYHVNIRPGGTRRPPGRINKINIDRIMFILLSFHLIIVINRNKTIMSHAVLEKQSTRASVEAMLKDMLFRLSIRNSLYSTKLSTNLFIF